MIYRIFAIRALGAIVTFVLGVYLARVLGAKNYGQYAFILGSVAFAATVGQFGTGMALVKLRLGGDIHDAEETLGLYVWHVTTAFVGTFLFSSIIFFFSWRKLYVDFYVIIMVVSGFLVVLIARNLFQSIKRSDLSTLHEMLIVPLILIFVVFFLDITRVGNALIAYGISTSFVGVLFCMFFVTRLMNDEWGLDVRIYWRKWWAVSGGFLLAHFGHALLFVQLPIAFGYVGDSHDMGILSAAYRLAAIQFIAFSAIGIYVTPQFADHTLMANRSMIKKFLIKIVLLSFIMSFPVLMVILLFPSEVMFYVYGSEYAGSEKVLPVLATGLFAHAASGPMGVFLLMNGESKYYNIVSIVIGGAGILGVLLVGYIFGVMAAAWCMSLTVVIWKTFILSRSFYVYKKIAF